MKRTEHFFKLFAHYWNKYTRTGEMGPLERLAYADKTFDALSAWECGADVPPEELTPFARALIEKRIADGKERASRFHAGKAKAPTEALQDTYRNPTGCQQRPYRNPTEALQDASREPAGSQQGTEIEREKEKIGFQPQQAISNQSNPTQPNARADGRDDPPPPPSPPPAAVAVGADRKPTATHGPQDARRDAQAADPTRQPSPPPSPRTGPQGGQGEPPPSPSAVGGIAGTVKKIVVGTSRLGEILDDDYRLHKADPVGWFMADPKNRIGGLEDSKLPEAAAAYCKSPNQNRERAIAYYRQLIPLIGATGFKAELERLVGEDAQGELATVRDVGAVFTKRLKERLEGVTA